MYDQSRVPVSVLVPAKNEERNIEDCIKSVAWADEVIVLDSFSDDRTVSLAQALGAKVEQRAFDNFSAHKNWALDHVAFRHAWILILDADERVTPELAQEIRAVVEGSAAADGYYVARQNWFAGQWVRHGGWFPDRQLRLFRRGRARYESRIVHEHMLLNGRAGCLEQPLVHYDYKGIERYFDRHNTYSSMEAVEAYRTLRESEGMNERLLPSLVAGGAQRRRFLKNLAYRYLPARPLFKFLWMYVVRGGFLDGRIGFRFCLLHTFYEYQVSLKLEELQNANSPLHEKFKQFL